MRYLIIFAVLLILLSSLFVFAYAAVLPSPHDFGFPVFTFPPVTTSAPEITSQPDPSLGPVVPLPPESNSSPGPVITPFPEITPQPDPSLGPVVPLPPESNFSSPPVSTSSPESTFIPVPSPGPVVTSQPDFTLQPDPSSWPVDTPQSFPSSDPVLGYLPPDQFFSLVSDYSISVIAVQTSPNTPVDSSSGLKGILLKMFGSYSPTITQLRYQSNTSTNYTYVNDISPDYPWIASAVVFAIVLYCTFKLGGTFLCKV